MTPKQKRFCREYIIDLNGTLAAIRAGYSEKTAAQQAVRLLRNAKVQEYIQKLIDRRSKRTEITADKVLGEIATLAFGNIRNIYDDKGNLKPIQDLTPEQTACISEIKTISKFDKDGNETTYTTYKISDKGVNLERLGKHLKLFTDKIELDGGVTVKVVKKRFDGE